MLIIELNGKSVSPRYVYSYNDLLFLFEVDTNLIYVYEDSSFLYNYPVNKFLPRDIFVKTCESLYFVFGKGEVLNEKNN